MNDMIRIPVVLYRGGTSKGVFFKENDLPVDPQLRDRIICAVFGSPDKRQIDGLGGADPLTSKVAIIGPPSRPDADVDYTFGQVDIGSANIYYGGVCGNISAAVGPYAVDEGLVRAAEPSTRIRVHSKNIGRIIEALVPTRDNRVVASGDFAIDGVPGTGAKIELNWVDTVGANTGRLLPTGNPQDRLEVEGYDPVTVSLVDVGNVGLFIRAADLGLRGTEGPDEVDPDAELLKRIAAIEAAAYKKIGRYAFLTFVSEAQNYTDYTTGHEIAAADVDYLVRMIFMGKMHKTYAASMINCCGTASVVPGTVVNEVTSPEPSRTGIVRMGHPAGKAELETQVEVAGTAINIRKILVNRTARRLMEGYAYIKPESLR